MLKIKKDSKVLIKTKKIIKQTIGLGATLKIRDIFERFSPADKELIAKRKSFYQDFVHKGDLCFDVGANIGNRITPFLQIGAKVLAVEPQEACYKFLQWKFGNTITLVTKGLCEEECVRKFHISTNTSAISSFSDEWINSVKQKRFKANNWDRTIDVEMTTLDNLIRQYGKPSFIKIDVEGYELEVLKGLSTPVKMISFEFTVPEQTGKIIDCIRTVQKINPDMLCNFSIGENMEWAKQEWLTPEAFIQLINSNEFIGYGFGDIYLKQNNI